MRNISMKIGIVKEIKNHEYRVSITPSGVYELTSLGHIVYVESLAGCGAGYHDEDYEQVGGLVLSTAKEVFEKAILICKVKEPQESEYPLIQPHHIIFTYFHFAASKSLTQAMMMSKACCIAYETVVNPQKELPLLVPMSMIAGRLSIQEGAQYLLKPNGGNGTLLAGVPGVERGKVLVLGAGTVGKEAARIAAGMGADVWVLDINVNKLSEIEKELQPNVRTLYSNRLNISSLLPDMDIVIGAVLVPGGKAPTLIKKEDLSKMKNGSVLIDVAVDQGGCIETIKPTTFADPIYEIDGVIHYGVANMPGSVPKTSTLALSGATLPYVKLLADYGVERAFEISDELKSGLNIYRGEIILPALKTTFSDL